MSLLSEGSELATGSLAENTEKQLSAMRRRAKAAVAKAIQDCPGDYCTCCRGNEVCTNPNKKR